MGRAGGPVGKSICSANMNVKVYIPSTYLTMVSCAHNYSTDGQGQAHSSELDGQPH